MTITLTDTASKKIKTLLEDEKKVGYGLRVMVSGGGCHGFQYGMTFEQEARQDDNIMEFDGLKVFVDPKSAPHLEGTAIDYVDAIHGAGFAIKNPQAKSTCGCGTSFGT